MPCKCAHRITRSNINKTCLTCGDQITLTTSAEANQSARNYSNARQLNTREENRASSPIYEEIGNEDLNTHTTLGLRKFTSDTPSVTRTDGLMETEGRTGRTCTLMVDHNNMKYERSMSNCFS